MKPCFDSVEQDQQRIMLNPSPGGKVGEESALYLGKSFFVLVYDFLCVSVTLCEIVFAVFKKPVAIP